MSPTTPSATPAPGAVSPAPGWPEPRPLPAVHQKPPAIPVDLIPEPIRDRVVDLAERIGVPAEAVLAPTIVGLGRVIGNTRRIFPKAHEEEWFEIATFWAMLVAGPSTKKSATITQALRPLRDIEESMYEEYKAGAFKRAATLTRIETQLAEVQKLIRTADTPAKVESLEDELAKLYEREAEARRSAPRLVVNDVTVEKLGELLAENPRGLVTVRDELSGLFAQMNAVGRENDRSFLLEAYNADGSYTFDRIGRGTTRVPSVSLSIVGGIQPEIVKPLIRKSIETAGGDGFLSRFQLPVLYDLGSVPRDEDRPVNQAAAGRAHTIYEHLQAQAQQHLSNPHRVSPSGFHFDPDAQKYMDAWRLGIEKRIQSPELGGFPAFQAHLGKTAGFGMRLALLFHAIDEADGRRSDYITLEQAKAATGLAEYYLKHAEALYECTTVPSLQTAHRLLEKFKNGDFDDGIKTPALQRATGINKADLMEALQVLESHNWVKLIKQKNPGAKASTVVQLHPNLLQD